MRPSAEIFAGGGGSIIIIVYSILVDNLNSMFRKFEKNSFLRRLGRNSPMSMYVGSRHVSRGVWAELYL